MESGWRTVWSGRPKSIISPGGAVGSVGSPVSDVNVGTSGKYPPPIEPFLSLGEGSIGDTLSSCTALYGNPSRGYGSYPDGPGPGEPRAETSADGCKDWSRKDFRASSASSRSCSSGTSTTDGCRGFIGWPRFWTSRSFGSRAGNSSSGAASCLGFDSFGSLPSFNAFAILTAFHFAYLILACVSPSAGPQILISSRNVAAAWKVSAVCLPVSQHLFIPSKDGGLAL